MRFNRFMNRRLREANDGDGNDGGGSGNENQNNDGGNGGGDNKPSQREADLLKEVMKRKEKQTKLETDLAAAGTRATELETKLKAFEGIDVEQVRKLLNDQKAAETKKLEDQGQWDRVKAQMVTEHESAITRISTEAKTQIEELTGKLGQATAAINDLTIGRAFGDSNFVRESLTLTPSKARVVYGSHFELQDGKVVAFDKPAGAAQRTLLVDGKGDALSFEEAMTKIIDADADKDQLLKSKIRQGANSRSDNNGGHEPKVELTGRNRIAAAIAAGKLKS